MKGVNAVLVMLRNGSEDETVVAAKFDVKDRLESIAMREAVVASSLGSKTYIVLAFVELTNALVGM